MLCSLSFFKLQKAIEIKSFDIRKNVKSYSFSLDMCGNEILGDIYTSESFMSMPFEHFELQCLKSIAVNKC